MIDCAQRVGKGREETVAQPTLFCKNFAKRIMYKKTYD